MKGKNILRVIQNPSKKQQIFKKKRKSRGS